MHYIIPPTFISSPSSPTVSPLLLPSPPPRPPPPPPDTSHPLGQDPPVTTTSDKTRPTASAPFSDRVPELATSQYIACPGSASLRCRPRSLQSKPPPLMHPEVDITSPPPTVSLAVSPLSADQYHVENFLGTVPCRGSSSMSPTRKSAPPVPPTWKTSRIYSG